MKTEPTISTFSVTKGGKVAETYASFQMWDLGASLDDNLARLREENPILAPTDAWLKEMRRIFRVRFGDIDRHAPLIRLTQGANALSQEAWAPILLWHLCFRELLVSDFLESWLYDRKQEGMLRVRSDDVRVYLSELKPRGLIDTEWKTSSISRMASGLPSYVADFGLLQGKACEGGRSLPSVERGAPLRATRPRAGDIQHGKNSCGPPLASFLDISAELEEELLRLHQHRELRFELAGTLVALELPYKTLDEYVDYLVG